jgi:hypothetical protein
MAKQAYPVDVRIGDLMLFHFGNPRLLRPLALTGVAGPT